MDRIIKINTPILSTDRLLLRKFSETDMEAMLAIYGDEEVNTYLPWFPLKTLDETKIFYNQKYAEAYTQSQGYQYAVCLKNDNIPIGYVKVSMDASHDLGYGLRKEFWHRGIITEACKAIAGQVEKDGLPYITATHDVKNPRSGSVMKQLGMSYRYSYEEQWQPKNIPVIFRMYQLNFGKEDKWIYTEYWDKASIRFVETNV